jgi:hypothetical protein
LTGTFKVNFFSSSAISNMYKLDLDRHQNGKSVPEPLRTDLREVSDDEAERVFLHVSRLASVRRLQDLENVLHRHVPLQVRLAEHLQPTQQNVSLPTYNSAASTTYDGLKYFRNLINLLHTRIHAFGKSSFGQCCDPDTHSDCGSADTDPLTKINVLHENKDIYRYRYVPDE